MDVKTSPRSYARPSHLIAVPLESVEYEWDYYWLTGYHREEGEEYGVLTWYGGLSLEGVLAHGRFVREGEELRPGKECWHGRPAPGGSGSRRPRSRAVGRPERDGSCCVDNIA